MSGRGGRGFGGQDGAGECGDVVAAVMAAAVDEEGRGAGDAAQVRSVGVLGDPRGAGVLAKVLTESLEAGEQPRRAGNAERLARDVADEDAKGDGRGVGAGEEGAADRDAGVGEREQRDDDVAGPGMVELLESRVRGQCRGEPGAR